MKTVLNILKWAGILLLALILIGSIIYQPVEKGKLLLENTDQAGTP